MSIGYSWKVEPVCIGPTWKRNPNWDGLDPLGKFILPEFTLGWQIIDWIGENLLGDETTGDGKTQLPFKLTPEQARFLLWWYAVDEEGRFSYRDGVLQRLKGWGKDPLVAVICVVELIGPCRFAGWAMHDMPELGLHRGDPVAKENPSAWVDVAAVSMEQTRNTFALFPSLISEKCQKKHFMNKQSFGQTMIYAHRGQRFIRAVTSNPRSLEGGRASFVVRNETHHWLANNNGHKMAQVIERNATKSKGGAARALSITNAYEPSEDSVAQRQREAWENEDAGLAISTGVLYDSLEIGDGWGLRPPELKGSGIADLSTEDEEIMTRAYLATVLEAVRGDAWWLNIPRLTDSILDRNNSPSLSRRWWFNQIVSSEDAWVDAAAVDAGEDPIARSERKIASQADSAAMLKAGWIVAPTDPIVMFGDGSKSDDATALVGVRLSDGYTFTIGVWQRPQGLDPRARWLVPRGEVDIRVDEAFERFNIQAFWFDPSHALDDDNERYWDGYVDGWHRRHGDKLDGRFWSIKTGLSRHSVNWDMTSPERQKQFVASAEQVRGEIEHRRGGAEEGEFAPLFTHDGHPALKAHLKSARRNPVALIGGFTGISIRKEHRESAKKIDLAACVVGARMLRRLVLNAGEEEVPETKGGWARAV